MLVGMTPRPELTASDYENPDAPEEELRLRADHPLVRDLSYERSRTRQLNDLFMNSIIDLDIDPDRRGQKSDRTPERLELYIKERSRGEGYVADFVFRSGDLPVTVYGILIDRGRGLEVAELELFRTSWGYFDEWGDFVGADGDRGPKYATEPDQIITANTLRRIPLGRIVSMAQQSLLQEEWRTEGIQVVMGPARGPDELSTEEIDALEAGVRAAKHTKRGRPPLPDSTLDDVAHAYLEEAAAGVGVLHRLARRFDRPEATIRDWIGAARRRGYLTPAVPGKRGAGPGPCLSAVSPDRGLSADAGESGQRR